jgi:DNA polymerase-3 subunit epsilon
MLRRFKKKNLIKDLEAKRRKCLENNLPSVLKLNLNSPIPDKNTPFQMLSFLVIDFETTGFEAEDNDIISIGWVEISQMQINLATQKHYYINNSKRINHETAVINHIVPQMVSHGISLPEAINILLQSCQDKILVVHGKVIEKNFLDFYAQQSFGLPSLPLIWIDTLKIEQWRALAKGADIYQDNRLSTARERYNLPQYNAHNALIDSISAAELLLAQIAHIYPGRKVTFEQLYEISQ